MNLRKERKISLVFTYEINRDSDMMLLFISISSNPRKKDKCNSNLVNLVFNELSSAKICNGINCFKLGF